MKPTALLVTLGLSLTSNAVASAQSVTFLSQERYISVEAMVHHINGEVTREDDAHALDFAPFDEFVVAVRALGGGEGRADADQRSSISTSYLHAAGTISSSASSSVVDYYEGQSRADNHFEVDFQVNAPVTYTLCGYLEGLDNGSASVGLFEGTTTLLYESATGPSEQRSVDLTGVLQPGTYNFRIRAGGGAYVWGFADAIFDLVFGFEPLIDTYCVTSPNSAGAGARIGWVGSNRISQDDFQLTATASVPQTVGIFFHGTTQVQLPFGDGVRCVGGSIFRLPPAQASDASGSTVRAVDVGMGTPFRTGERWNFQYWYRDTAAGGAGFNVSDGLSVVFCE